MAIVESSDLIVALGVTFLLIVVAYLAGVMKPRAALKEAPKKKTQPIEKPRPVEQTPAEEEEIDEFSFELDEPAEELTSEMTQAHAQAIEIIEIPDEADETPSGRLASLRDEMTTNGPSAEGREDRMRKFFGNE